VRIRPAGGKPDAHDVGTRRVSGGRMGRRNCPVEMAIGEMAIGIALVVIAIGEIWLIVRVVSSNLNLGR